MLNEGTRNFKKADHSTWPTINIPIANIGVTDGSKSLLDNVKSNLPNEKGEFKNVNKNYKIFDELPEEIETNGMKFKCAPTHSEWSKNVSSKEMKEILNAGGMIVKKLRLRDNSGELKITSEDCKMDSSDFERSVGRDKLYQPYNQEGTDGKRMDEQNVETCDAFYRDYSRKIIEERGCVIYDESKDKAILDESKPGCRVDDYERHVSGMFNTGLSYPHDVACMNSAFGTTLNNSTIVDGREEYNVYDVIPEQKNPLVLDQVCATNINNIGEFGEAYMDGELRAAANKNTCINVATFENIQSSGNVTINANQVNRCETVTVEEEEEIEEEIEELIEDSIPEIKEIQEALQTENEKIETQAEEKKKEVLEEINEPIAKETIEKEKEKEKEKGPPKTSKTPERASPKPVKTVETPSPTPSAAVETPSPTPSAAVDTP